MVEVQRSSGGKEKKWSWHWSQKSWTPVNRENKEGDFHKGKKQASKKGLPHTKIKLDPVLVPFEGKALVKKHLQGTGSLLP